MIKRSRKVKESESKTQSETRSIEYSIQSYIGNYLRDQIEYPKSSDKALLSVSL